jgi:hypothetical protein
VAATAVELVVLSGLGARASRPAVPAARRGPVATVGPAGGDATPARRT